VGILQLVHIELGADRANQSTACPHDEWPGCIPGDMKESLPADESDIPLAPAKAHADLRSGVHFDRRAILPA
jgi:hypothetical protein